MSDMRQDIRTKAKEAAEAVQRDLIADAACSVMAREGLEAASMRRIAQELDSTTGLITHYFASKEDLLIHAMRRGTSSVYREVGAEFAVEPRSFDELVEWILRTLPTNERLRDFWRVLLCFRTAALGNGRIAAEYYDYRNLMAHNMAVGVAAGAGRAVDDPVVVQAALLMQSLFVGLGLSAAIEETPMDLDVVRPMFLAAVDCLLDQVRLTD